MKPMLAALAAVSLLSASSAPATAKARKPVCPAVTAFNTGMTHLEGYRVFVGPDGDSAVEPYRIDARIIPLFKTGQKLGVLDLPKSGPRQPQIFIGPANLDLPLRAPAYKELFVLLSGGFTFKTAKVSIPMKPGSMLFFDDVGATRGHGARVGPCGYVSLSIAP